MIGLFMIGDDFVLQKALDILMKQHMPKKEQRKRGWLWWGGKDTAAPLPNASSSEKLDSAASKVSITCLGTRLSLQCSLSKLLCLTLCVH